ncbi:hypothetical protein ACQRBF_04255 [Peptoniphilaceae bacterium SGI.131]
MRKPDTVVTKNQFKLSVLTTILTFVTLAIILFENHKKVANFYSFISIGVVFLLNSLNQAIYYKNNKRFRNLFQALMYFIAGVAVLIYIFVLKK